MRHYTIQGPDLKELRDEFHTSISPQIAGFIKKRFQGDSPLTISVQRDWHHQPFVLYKSLPYNTPTEIVVAELYFAMELHPELHVTEVHCVKLEFNFGDSPCQLLYYPNNMVAEFIY